MRSTVQIALLVCTIASCAQTGAATAPTKTDNVTSKTLDDDANKGEELSQRLMDFKPVTLTVDGKRVERLQILHSQMSGTCSVALEADGFFATKNTIGERGCEWMAHWRHYPVDPETVEALQAALDGVETWTILHSEGLDVDEERFVEGHLKFGGTAYHLPTVVADVLRARAAGMRDSWSVREKTWRDTLVIGRKTNDVWRRVLIEPHGVVVGWSDDGEPTTPVRALTDAEHETLGDLVAELPEEAFFSDGVFESSDAIEISYDIPSAYLPGDVTPTVAQIVELGLR